MEWRGDLLNVLEEIRKLNSGVFVVSSNSKKIVESVKRVKRKSSPIISHFLKTITSTHTRSNTHRTTQQEHKNNGVLSYQTAVYGLRVRRRQDEVDRVGGDRTIRGDGIVEFEEQYEEGGGFENVDYVCLCGVVQG